MTNDGKNKELVLFNGDNPIELFGKKDGLSCLLEKYKNEVKAELFDVTTKEGRARIASVAGKIGRDKVNLEKIAMGLTEDWRTKTSNVNAEKKKMKEAMDGLRDDIFAPLGQYREQLKKHEEDRENRIALIKRHAIFEDDTNPVASKIEQHILSLKETYKFEWAEFKDRADSANSEVSAKLKYMLEGRKKYDAEQEELAELRKKAAEQEKKDHEDRIAKEAADKARIDAENKAMQEKEKAAAVAHAEKQRIQSEKLAAENREKEAHEARIEAEKAIIAANKQAEIDKAEAKKKADEEKAAAVKAETIRQESEREAIRIADKKRAEDKEHKAKINREALESIQLIVGVGVNGHQPAKDIITAIAKGAVRHVTIKY